MHTIPFLGRVNLNRFKTGLHYSRRDVFNLVLFLRSNGPLPNSPHVIAGIRLGVLGKTIGLYPAACDAL